ncbi:MAG: branched-chain amino acid ABC transporter substrate-binding protein [Bradyrhizobiaceae bacterium]|nr:branched-chain amino acid ABC transporter substrate-binding protein [Bradyrhizobiaceae bacterium]
MRFGSASFAVAASVATCLASAATAQAEDTIKLGFIDPLSGGGATVGEPGLKTYQYIADVINAAGGVNGRKLEVFGFDNKTNPQESLVQAQKAIDQGIHFITQGNGSSVAAALNDFVAKYGDRNPGHEVLYLNYAAVDPVLTNEKCSFWHFRWDANSDIKMQALTSFIKDKRDTKKVYLINQDYSFGQSVRKQARAMLKAKRPDIEIVGDEVHPLLKVTDFAPYVAKIKASGADSIITGNWGQDIALLLKAAADAGLQANWYTYYAGGPGGPTAIRQSRLEHRIYAIAEWVPNSEPEAAARIETEFRAKMDMPIYYPRALNEVRMLAKAIELAKSDDAKAVAEKLEGMKFTTFMGGEGFMRKEDHQFFQDMYISSFGPLDPGAKFDEEKTGWGWKTAGTVKAKDTVLPTTCSMNRPS